MAKKELVDYIKKETKAGYDVSYLRDYLIKQGYRARDVDEAIDSIYGKQKRIGIKIPTKFIILSAIALIIVIAGIFTIVRLIEPSAEQPVYFPEINEEQETIIEIPPARPAEETSSETQEEERVEVRYVGPAPQLSIVQVLERIPNLTESEAVSLCKKFSGKDKDNCYNRIALEKGNSELCAEIVNIRKKDNCYMSFAYLDDYSVCTNIQDIYLRQSCRELGKLEFNITSQT